jgi:hypothetical protein
MKAKLGLVLAAALMALAACRGERSTITGSYGSGVVTGRVVVVTGVENRSPAGMQVSVRGTGMTTTLAADGGFAFSGVPEGAELLFRRVWHSGLEDRARSDRAEDPQIGSQAVARTARARGGEKAGGHRRPFAFKLFRFDLFCEIPDLR